MSEQRDLPRVEIQDDYSPRGKLVIQWSLDGDLCVAVHADTDKGYQIVGVKLAVGPGSGSRVDPKVKAILGRALDEIAALNAGKENPHEKLPPMWPGRQEGHA